jgi:hypothetical protein
MPEPAAPHRDPSTTTTPFSSPEGTVPPMPSEVTPMHTRTKGHAAAGRWLTAPPMPSEVTPVHPRTKGHTAAGRWRTAMMPLRKMMHRTPPDAA